MKLEAEARQFPMPHGRHGAQGGAGQRVEAGRRRQHSVSMAHPDLGLRIHAPQQGVVSSRRPAERGLSVLPVIQQLHPAPIEMGHQLVAVTQPQQRLLQEKKVPIEGHLTLPHHGLGPAGKNHAPGQSQFLLGGHGRKNQRQHTQMTDALGDQVSVLPSKIDDGDEIGLLVCHSLRR